MTGIWFVLRNTWILILAVAMLPVNLHGQSDLHNDGKLIWSEEFDYKGLPDESKWNIVVGKSRVNNEPQYYTSELKNLNVANGNLTITVRLEEVEGEMRYTSGRINTMGKFETTCGRVEARAKLPQGRGVWPAFWMLGTTGRWPACGEIDIMEYWGHDSSTVASNVHTADYNHMKRNGRGGKITVKQPWEDFHIFAVEWYKDRLDFFMDDSLYFSCKSKGEGIGEWPFDSPEFIILNLALWNNWAGQPGIDDNIFPQEFVIDYVRVYELSQ